MYGRALQKAVVIAVRQYHVIVSFFIRLGFLPNLNIILI